MFSNIIGVVVNCFKGLNNIINDNTIEITKELVIGVEYTIYNLNDDENVEKE